MYLSILRRIKHLNLDYPRLKIYSPKRFLQQPKACDSDWNNPSKSLALLILGNLIVYVLPSCVIAASSPPKDTNNLANNDSDLCEAYRSLVTSFLARSNSCESSTVAGRWSVSTKAPPKHCFLTLTVIVGGGGAEVSASGDWIASFLGILGGDGDGDGAVEVICCDGAVDETGGGAAKVADCLNRNLERYRFYIRLYKCENLTFLHNIFYTKHIIVVNDFFLLIQIRFLLSVILCNALIIINFLQY